MEIVHLVRKPIPIEAARIEAGHEAGYDLVAWVKNNGGVATYRAIVTIVEEDLETGRDAYVDTAESISVYSAEEITSGRPGDWIYRTVDNEFYIVPAAELQEHFIRKDSLSSWQIPKSSPPSQ